MSATWAIASEKSINIYGLVDYEGKVKWILSGHEMFYTRIAPDSESDQKFKSMPVLRLVLLLLL